jgi:hypothetical protein
MLQDTSTIEYKHKKFVERIVDLDTVWGLQSDEGFATSDSNDFDDAEVIPFWSDKAYANAVAKEGWEHYQPTSMPLSEFLENWLIGMHNDELLVGTNWDQNMFGKEIEPLDLALEITEQLIAKGKAPTFNNYQNINDYQIQVRKALGLTDACR